MSFRRRLFCGTSLSLRLACTQSSSSHARHLWTKSRRQGVFWWGDGRRRSWPMYRWKFSFKPWISSPSQCVFHRGFTEASSRLVPNQPPEPNVPVHQSHREAPTYGSYDTYYHNKLDVPHFYLIEIQNILISAYKLELKCNIVNNKSRHDHIPS